MTAPKHPPARAATYRVGDLNTDQRRRAACLQAARLILGPDANLMLCVRVARWLYCGTLPASEA